VPAVSVAEVEPVPTVIEVTPAPLPTAVPTPSGPPAAAAGAGTGSGSGSGAGAGEGGSPLLPADWIVKPEEKMRELNPPRAVYDRISGQVLLHCRITVDQKVRGCRVMKEYPRGYGFGAAALKLSKFFRIRPPAAGGVILTETRVPIPVIWENPPFKRGRTPSSR
jgi:protein TonB